jgi:hypothetical protein
MPRWRAILIYSNKCHSENVTPLLTFLQRFPQGA